MKGSNKEMRRYKGLSCNTGKWVHGDLAHNEINDTWIMNMHSVQGEGTFDNVKPRSVGQGTGEIDKEGTEIFSGDVVELDNFNPARYLVEFIEGAYVLTHPSLEGFPLDITFISSSKGCCAKIVGTAYEMGKHWYRLDNNTETKENN